MVPIIICTCHLSNFRSVIVAPIDPCRVALSRCVSGSTTRRSRPRLSADRAGARKRARSRTLTTPPRATLPRDGRPIGADISRRPGWSATTLWQSSYLAAGQAAQAAPIGTNIAPPGRRPFARPVRAADHQRPSRGLGSWRLPPRPPRAVLCTRSGARSLEFRIEYAQLLFLLRLAIRIMLASVQVVA